MCKYVIVAILEFQILLLENPTGVSTNLNLVESANSSFCQSNLGRKSKRSLGL